MKRIVKRNDIPKYIPVGAGAARKIFDEQGRNPPVSMIITPLDGGKRIYFDRFLTYQFNSAITVPVDTFNFSAVAPDTENSFDTFVKSGDIVSLFCNDQPLSTGIIDMVDIETDSQFGERVMISGRDLLSQYEEQDAISINDKPIWGDKFTIKQVIMALNENTRITNDISLVNTANLGGLLFSTEPGETKLSALQRFLEPLNLLAWTGPTGKIIVGKPSMKASSSQGNLFMLKSQRRSNVLNIKVIRNTATIPNIIVPIFPVQESSQFISTPQQRRLNSSPGPDRLRRLGHRLPKTVNINHPQGAAARDFSEANRLNANPTFSNLIGSYANREIARANHQETVVQITVPRHINDQGVPFMQDQVYKITYDRGNIDEEMYLFQVAYELTEDRGQVTNLFFCRLGTIVAGVVTR